MGKYMTKQRRMLSEYLSEHGHTPMTAREIADGVREYGISVSAVYRNLAVMEEDGLIKRAGTDKGHNVRYRYAGAPACKGCIHLTCSECGNVFHLEKESAEKLVKSISDCDGFTVNMTDTVIYGVCGKCGKRV